MMSTNIIQLEIKLDFSHLFYKASKFFEERGIF